jgi:hypothetical protein
MACDHDLLAPGDQIAGYVSADEAIAADQNVLHGLGSFPVAAVSDQLRAITMVPRQIRAMPAIL